MNNVRAKNRYVYCITRTIPDPLDVCFVSPSRHPSIRSRYDVARYVSDAELFSDEYLAELRLEQILSGPLGPNWNFKVVRLTLTESDDTYMHPARPKRSIRREKL